jgi:predicted dehydrogenase
MSSFSRRRFIRTGAAAAGTVALSQIARAQAPASSGSNDTIRVGVIGVKGRGISHINGLEALDGVEVAALCDVDEGILNQRADDLDKRTSRKTARHTDLRKLFEDKSIDVVSIATPNHWHTLAAIWAMQAGKDVYVEKPCSHNVFEGRQLVKAAAKYGRMCQHGTQSRSVLEVQEGIKLLREGVIGDIYMARGVCYKWRDTIGKTPDEPVPPGVHYDIWLGPAPKRAFSRNRFHYEWHWNWDYGNGDIGNQGVHEMDLARWGLGVSLPSKIQSMGGRFMWDDDKQVPNTQVSSFYYPERNAMLVFEIRHWAGPHEAEFATGKGNDTGAVFFGAKGYMTLTYKGYQVFLGREREVGPSKKGDGGAAWGDFIKAVRSRKVEDLSATAEDGHLSAAHCHLANIAYLTGRTITFDPKSEKIIGDSEAAALLTRDYREPYVVREL